MSKLLSVCMIVKDEEAVIERCLSSIAGYADEIIIMDTGSTDRTKEIASTYTSTIYDFTWTNDFSAARNEGIRRAVSKWILVIDADEYYPPAEAERLREFLADAVPEKGNVYAVSVVSYLGESIDKSSMLSTGEVPRLFPNHHDVYYTRPIHEQLHCTDGTPLQFRLAPGSLYHTGYLKDTIVAKDKSNRNASIFNDLKKTTGFTAYDYYTIGNEKAVKRDFQNAIYYYERGLKKGERNSSVSWYPRCIVSLVQAYLELKRIPEAWNLIETRLVHWSQYPEYHALRGSIYYYVGLFPAAKEAYLLAYKAAEKLAETQQVFWLDSPDFASSIPLRVLSDIAALENDNEKSIYYLTKLLIQNPFDYRAATQLIDLLSLSQSTEAISQLMSEIGDGNDRKYQLFLFKTSLALGKIELSAHYFSLLKEVTSELDPYDLLNYALLHQEEDMFSEALDVIATEETPKPDAYVTSALGSLLWNKVYIDRLTVPPGHPSHENFCIYRSFAEKEPVHSEHDIYCILSKCYLFQLYDWYDTLVNAYSTAEITNLLANFFYNKKNVDLAMNYYSLLLRNNELNVASQENLALYHLTHGFIDDGLAFILETLEKRPQLTHLLTLYLQHCSNQDAKQAFIKKYGDGLTFYRKIPALAPLVN